MSSTEKSTVLPEAVPKASLPITELVTGGTTDEALVVTTPSSAVPDALELARTLLT